MPQATAGKRVCARECRIVLDYSIENDESVLLENHGVTWLTRGEELDSFVLTNKKIYCQYEKNQGLFKRSTKETNFFNLSDIMIFDGQSAVEQIKHERSWCLQIRFRQGWEYFAFKDSPKKVIPQWIAAINAQLGTLQTMDSSFNEKRSSNFSSFISHAPGNIKNAFGSAAKTAKNKKTGYKYYFDGTYTMTDSTAQQTNAGTTNRYATCSNCGSEIIPGTVFCMNCGQKVGTNNNETASRDTENERASVHVYCENCGSEIIPGTAFCMNCGQKVSTNNNENAAHKPKNERASEHVFCENCGGEIIRGKKYCPNCAHEIGKSVNEVSEQTPEKKPTRGTAFCEKCGEAIIPGTKYCPNCAHEIGKSVIEPSMQEPKQGKEDSPSVSEFKTEGKSVEEVEEKEKTHRKQEYTGKVLKCPNCGEVLKSFAPICPSCGCEVRDMPVSNAVREFMLKLEKSQTDKQAVAIIKNHPIPNTREDMYEFMVIAVTGINSEKSESTAAAWRIKFEQCYHKALLMLPESDLPKIEKLHEEIEQKDEQLKLELDKAQAEKIKRKRQNTIRKAIRIVLRNMLIVFGAVCFVIALVQNSANEDTALFELISGILLTAASALQLKKRTYYIEIIIAAALGIAFVTVKNAFHDGRLMLFFGVVSLILSFVGFVKKAVTDNGSEKEG